MRQRLTQFFLIAALLPVVLEGRTYGQEWMQASAPEGRVIRMAVFRPQGGGPFPTVVVLHGTSGFLKTHMELAKYFAENGFVGVAACWFGGHFRGGRNPRPARYADGIDCPDGPDLKQPGRDSAGVAEDLRALISAVQKLPAVRAERVALFGHSRGSAASLVAASNGIPVQAVVAVAGYLPMFANGLQAPVLILQGTADDQTDAQEARGFERKVRDLGKPVEAHYYDNAPHDIPWLAPWQDDVRRRSIEFFKKYLAGN